MTTESRLKLNPSLNKPVQDFALNSESSRERLQSEIYNSNSFSPISVHLNGKQINLLKQQLGPEQGTVEELIHRFVDGLNPSNKSRPLTESDVKGLIERISESFRANRQNLKISEAAQNDLRIYLENLLSQRLEEKKLAQDRELEERKAKNSTSAHVKEIAEKVLAGDPGKFSIKQLRDLGLTETQASNLLLLANQQHKAQAIEKLSDQFQQALYNQNLAEKLQSRSESDMQQLANQVAQTRKLLIEKAGPQFSADLKTIEAYVEQEASNRALKIKRIHDQIKGGVSNGNDLATIMVGLSKSEYSVLCQYFKEKDTEKRELWVFTEKEFSNFWWGNKEAGRKAHSGEVSNSDEFRAKQINAQSVKTIQFILNNLDSNSSTAIVSAFGSDNPLLELQKIKEAKGAVEFSSMIKNAGAMISVDAIVSSEERELVKQLIEGKSFDRQQLFDFYANKIAIISLHSAQNLVLSAANDNRDSFIEKSKNSQAAMNEQLRPIYLGLQACGIDTSKLQSLQEESYLRSLAGKIQLVTKELSVRKFTESGFFEISTKEDIKLEANKRGQIWEQRLNGFKDKIALTGIFGSDIEKNLNLSAVIEESKAIAAARAKELAKSFNDINVAAEGWRGLFGTDESMLLGALKDSSGKFFTPQEIRLLSDRQQLEYEVSLDDEIRDELGDEDLNRALAIVRGDQQAILACDINAELGKFFGPDKTQLYALTKAYGDKPPSEKKELDQLLTEQGLLRDQQTLRGYCLDKLGGNNLKIAEVNLLDTKDPKAILIQKAAAIAILIKEKQSIFGDDHAAIGKILTDELIRVNPESQELELGEFDTVLLEEVKKQYWDIFGDILEDRFNGSARKAQPIYTSTGVTFLAGDLSPAEKWISSILQAKDLAYIDATKYAYAVKENNLELAASIYNRGAAEGVPGLLEQIISIPDDSIREKKLIEYQKIMQKHIESVEQHCKSLFSGAGLDSLASSKGAPNTTQELTINGRILQEYRSYLSKDSRTIGVEEFQALRSVTRLHLAMRNKTGFSDGQAVLDEVIGSSNRLLKITEATYARLIQQDLRDDLQTEVRDIYGNRAKWILQGDPDRRDPRYANNELAYMKAVHQRMEERFAIENSGSSMAKTELVELGKICFQMKSDIEFLEKNKGKQLSQQDAERADKIDKRFFLECRRFEAFADIHCKQQIRKSEALVNDLTTLAVFGVGFGGALVTGGQSLWLLGAYTASAGLGVRYVTKNILYGWNTYDYRSDLQEDVVYSLRDGAAAYVGGAAFKGLSAVRLAVAKKVNFKVVESVTGKTQQWLSSRVGYGVRRPVRQLNGEVSAEYAGGGLLNRAANGHIPTAYASVTKRALENPELMRNLTQVVQQTTGKSIQNGGINQIERNLAQLSLRELKNAYTSAISNLPKQTSRQLLSEFQTVNTLFLSSHVSTSASAFSRFALGATSGVVDGAVTGSAVGATYQAFSPETFEDGFRPALGRILSGAVEGAKFGAMIGGTVGAVAYSFSSAARKAKPLTDQEIADLPNKKTFFGNKPKYSSERINELKAEQGGKLFRGNLKDIRDNAAIPASWELRYKLDAWRLRKVNQFVKNVSPELEAGYRIVDAIKIGKTPDANDLKLFAGIPSNPSLGQKIYLHAKLWWKVSIMGDFKLTPHQVGIAQELASKAQLTKYDIWQFRRTSQFGEVASDRFASRYGFYFQSPQYITPTAHTTSSSQIWGRGSYFGTLANSQIAAFQNRLTDYIATLKAEAKKTANNLKVKIAKRNVDSKSTNPGVDTVVDDLGTGSPQAVAVRTEPLPKISDVELLSLPPEKQLKYLKDKLFIDEQSIQVTKKLVKDGKVSASAIDEAEKELAALRLRVKELEDRVVSSNKIKAFNATLARDSKARLEAQVKKDEADRLERERARIAKQQKQPGGSSQEAEKRRIADYQRREAETLADRARINSENRSNKQSDSDWPKNTDDMDGLSGSSGSSGSGGGDGRGMGGGSSAVVDDSNQTAVVQRKPNSDWWREEGGSQPTYRPDLNDDIDGLSDSSGFSGSGGGGGRGMGGGSSLVLDNANRTAVVESKAPSAPTNPKPQPQLQRASPSNSNSSASKLALKDKRELDPSLKELLNSLKAAQESHPTPIGPKLQSEPAFNRAAVAQLTPQRVSALIDSASAPALVDSLVPAQGPDSFAQPGKSHSSNNKGKTKPVLEEELPLAFDSTETPLKRNEKQIRREEDLTRKKVARGLEIEERKAKQGRSFSINFRKRRYKDGGVAKQKLEEKTSEEFTWRTIGESVEGEPLAETPKNTASKKTV